MGCGATRPLFLESNIVTVNTMIGKLSFAVGCLFITYGTTPPFTLGSASLLPAEKNLIRDVAGNPDDSGIEKALAQFMSKARFFRPGDHVRQAGVRHQHTEKENYAGTGCGRSIVCHRALSHFEEEGKVSGARSRLINDELGNLMYPGLAGNMKRNRASLKETFTIGEAPATQSSGAFYFGGKGIYLILEKLMGYGRCSPDGEKIWAVEVEPPLSVISASGCEIDSALVLFFPISH
jgi:hypothetical protein